MRLARSAIFTGCLVVPVVLLNGGCAFETRVLHHHYPQQPSPSISDQGQTHDMLEAHLNALQGRLAKLDRLVAEHNAKTGIAVSELHMLRQQVVRIECDVCDGIQSKCDADTYSFLSGAKEIFPALVYSLYSGRPLVNLPAIRYERNYDKDLERIWVQVGELRKTIDRNFSITKALSADSLANKKTIEENKNAILKLRERHDSDMASVTKTARENFWDNRNQIIAAKSNAVEQAKAIAIMEARATWPKLVGIALGLLVLFLLARYVSDLAREWSPKFQMDRGRSTKMAAATLASIILLTILTISVLPNLFDGLQRFPTLSNAAVLRTPRTPGESDIPHGQKPNFDTSVARNSPDTDPAEGG